MSFTAILLILTIQTSEIPISATVRCRIDTDLPLDQISVTVKEKREVEERPRARGGSEGQVAIGELPEGDVNLLFYFGDSQLGKIKLSSVARGEVIKIKVRLVEGNAILLDEYRIKGVTESARAVVSSPIENPKPAEEPPQTKRVGAPPLRSRSGTTDYCPAPGEPLTLTGELIRIIDRDSFELRSGPRNYVIYPGSATQFHGSSTVTGSSDLRVGMTLVVEGTVAAGPKGECSLGARDVHVSN